jgi:hypothetical protein
MLKGIKNIGRSVLSRTVDFLANTKVGGYIFERILDSAMQATQRVIHGQTQLKFVIPNKLNRFACQHLFDKRARDARVD